MVESTRRFLLYTKMCQDAKKLAAFRHPHKIAPRFDHWLYFGFWARLGDVGNSLKTEIEFNYKLCFYSNTFNSCIQKQNTTRGWTCPLFSGMHRKISGAQKNCLHFIIRTKSALYVIIGCIHCVIQPVIEYGCGFLVCTERCQERKNICLYSATCTKLTRDSTIGWILLYFTIW